MNISKSEQRVLHVLAQGGVIDHVRGPNGKVKSVTCYTRDGFVLTDCTMPVFTRLKIRCLICANRRQILSHFDAGASVSAGADGQPVGRPKMTLTIRPTEARDTGAIGRLAETTDLFPVEMLDDMIEGYLDGAKPDLWFVVEEDDVLGFGFVNQSGWQMARGTCSP